MEKGVPHRKLTVVKAMIQAGKIHLTRSAMSGAAAMGFEFEDVCATILALSTKDFYKSMTSHNDHKVWQDVYRPETSAGPIYLKITVIDEVLVVSFKER